MDKESKSLIKLRIIYNGKSKTSRYIKTRFNIKKYYWKVYRKKLLSTNKPLKLSKVKYWAYQLQNIEKPGAVKKLASSKYDLLVIEPTRLWQVMRNSIPGKLYRISKNPGHMMAYTAN